MEQNKTTEQAGEQIIQIPLTDLFPFPNHPFKVKDDERMLEMTQSIRDYGVMMPIIVRPREKGGYEIVSGHRRQHACISVGLDSLPAIVRNLNDEETVVLMVDSNLQRENILPSERAYSYKMKLDAIKRQGERRDLTSGQLGPKLKTSADQVAYDVGGSRKQIQRYIRLTYLIPQLLEMVDEKKLAFNPAVELSYLKPNEQEQLVSALNRAQCSPSLSQALRMKNFSREHRLSVDVMDAILSEDKKQPLDRITFDRSSFVKYFPKSYTTEQMEEIIKKLLLSWQKKRAKDQER